MPPTGTHASKDAKDSLSLDPTTSKVSGETSHSVAADTTPHHPLPTARLPRANQREMSLFRPTTSLSTYFSQAPRTLQPDAAEFVPGGIPAALHQQQYPYPQISYQYGAIPTNFMVCYLGFVCRQPHSQAPWAHRGTAQYLPPQHPNSFPHAHMRDSRVIGLEIVEL